MTQVAAEPLAVTFDEDEDGLDVQGEGQDSQSQTPDPNQALRDIQSKYAELESRFERQAAENRQQVDQLNAADRMLAEVYGRRESADDLAGKVTWEEPEAPAVEQIIENPGLAVEYAKRYGDARADYIHKRTLAELTPFLSAISQVAPVVDGLTRLSSSQAIRQAKSHLSEDQQSQFDAMLPAIQKDIRGAQYGSQLALDPRSYLMSFAARGGQVQPVQNPSPRPRTAGTNSRADTGDATTPDRIPGYYVKWCRQAGCTDDKEIRERWKSRQAKRKGMS